MSNLSCDGNVWADNYETFMFQNEGHFLFLYVYGRSLINWRNDAHWSSFESFCPVAFLPADLMYAGATLRGTF